MSNEIVIEKFKPIGNKVLVLPNNADDAKTKGGIILIDETISKLHQHVTATVVAVSDKNSHIFNVGDTVIYKKMYELTIEVDGKKHILLKEEHIDAVGSN